ncbi:hypothetical protein Tco_0931849 [Tanacetum coccineum]
MLTMEQYLAWVQNDIRPGVVKPKINNDVEFEINSNFMRELKHKLFKGADDEDAHEHVRRVLEIADLFHFPNVTHDAVMLRVYPTTRRYDEATTRERINDSPNNVDTKKPKENIHAIQASFKNCKGAHLTMEYPLKKEDKAVEQSKKKLINNTGEKVKEKTTMGKENVKEPVPRNLPVVQTCVSPAQFLGNPYRTRETIFAIGIPEEIKEDEGDMNDGCDITVEDVERLRKILTPSIHALPIVQPYVPLGLVCNKAKVVRKEEQDYDIPPQDHVMHPLTPQTVHITPPDDDYVASATNPILNKHLNEFREEFADNTRVFKKIDSSLYKEIEFEVPLTRVRVVVRYVPWKPSRDFTRPLGTPCGLKGLLHMLNATVIPTKGKREGGLDLVNPDIRLTMLNLGLVREALVDYSCQSSPWLMHMIHKHVSVPVQWTLIVKIKEKGECSFIIWNICEVFTFHSWTDIKYGDSLEARGILDYVNDHLERLFLLWHSGFQSDISKADLDSLSRRNLLFITSSSL